MNLATIDVGTNTTLLLVAHASPAAVVPIEQRAEITRLGRGIGRDGALGVEGIAATLAVLTDYAGAARRHDATIVAVGTEALRRAPNAAAFLEPAAQILGVPIEVIDGAREAALTFRAVAASIPAVRAGSAVVVDIGGGSTEIVIAHDGVPAFDTSLPIGSVRLTERFVHRDPPAREDVDDIVRAIDGALAAVPFPARARTLVGVAGTVTTLAAMDQRLTAYDPARVHGARLGVAALVAQIDRLRACTQAERERIVGLDPRRADVILAGALILQRLCAGAGADAVVVSDRGIRWGLLYELLSKGAGA